MYTAAARTAARPRRRHARNVRTKIDQGAKMCQGMTALAQNQQPYLPRYPRQPSNSQGRDLSTCCLEPES